MQLRLLLIENCLDYIVQFTIRKPKKLQIFMLQCWNAKILHFLTRHINIIREIWRVLDVSDFIWRKLKQIEQFRRKFQRNTVYLVSSTSLNIVIGIIFSTLFIIFFRLRQEQKLNNLVVLNQQGAQSVPQRFAFEVVKESESVKNLKKPGFNFESSNLNRLMEKPWTYALYLWINTQTKEKIIHQCQQVINNQEIIQISHFKNIKLQLFRHFLQTFISLIDVVFSANQKHLKAFLKMLIFMEMVLSPQMQTKVDLTNFLDDYKVKFTYLLQINTQDQHKTDELLIQLGLILYKVLQGQHITEICKSQYNKLFSEINQFFKKLLESNKSKQIDNTDMVFIEANPNFEDYQLEQQPILQRSSKFRIAEPQNTCCYSFLIFKEEINFENTGVYIYPVNFNIFSSIPKIAKDIEERAKNQGGLMLFDFIKKTKHIHSPVGRNMTKRLQGSFKNQLSKNIKLLQDKSKIIIGYNVQFVPIMLQRQRKFIWRFCCIIRVNSMILLEKPSKQQILMLTEHQCQFKQIFKLDGEIDCFQSLEFAYEHVFTCSNNQNVADSLQKMGRIKALKKLWGLSFQQNTFAIYGNLSEIEMREQANLESEPNLRLIEVDKTLIIKGAQRLNKAILDQWKDSAQKHFPHQSFELYHYVHKDPNQIFLLGFSKTITLFMYYFISYEYNNQFTVQFFHDQKMQQRLQTFNASYNQQGLSEANIVYYSSISPQSELFIQRIRLQNQDSSEAIPQFSALSSQSQKGSVKLNQQVK